jgi:endonuclease/exonuclease/phosphatase family metal-dependent hydrolase
MKSRYPATVGCHPRVASLLGSVSRVCLVFLSAALVLSSNAVGAAQEPLDLFSDEPALGDDYIRLGVWNLRHINLESGARDFLSGANDDEDFAILVATFGKGIKDLGLDIVAIVEHQRRASEPNRLQQIQTWLQTNTAANWGRDESNISYDNGGNLQLGLLWREAKVTIDISADELLEDLRQPRDASGNLVERNLRAPWLVPVTAGSLFFDLIVVHLKSGGKHPQGDEVDALAEFIRTRQSGASPRHLIVAGDWNIRPDDSTGRNRLRQLMVPDGGGTLMRVLTIEEVPPTLQNWDALGPIGVNSPVATLIPLSHFNVGTIDTFLDHIAISRTFEEVFDHPIQVALANGEMDILPAIQIARPQIPELSYLRLTDHVPIMLILRTTDAGTPAPEPAPGIGVRIVAAVPNPMGSDQDAEAVHLRNNGSAEIQLSGWRIGDNVGSTWQLDASDGAVQPGETVVVLRRSRPMALNNSGDSIFLFHPSGTIVDSKSYGSAASGQLINFNGSPTITVDPH